MSRTAQRAITDETHIIRRLLGASRRGYDWRCACCGAREDLRLCDALVRCTLGRSRTAYGPRRAVSRPCNTVICGRHSQHTAPDTDRCPFHRESES